MIKGLHHNAYRCRDSEETRAFYEDFLGLRMVSAFEINAAAIPRVHRKFADSPLEEAGFELTVPP
jgi:catechol 2,3-dioxygenase-like lactoylglutathione lyase family enzyme